MLSHHKNTQQTIPFQELHFKKEDDAIENCAKYFNRDFIKKNNCIKYECKDVQTQRRGLYGRKNLT